MSRSKILAATALAIAATMGGAVAQGWPTGRVYTFHSKAQGGCPALDWHVTAEGDGSLSGMIAWNDMKSMAKATGTVNMQAKTFQMTAKEVGGQGATANITGSVRGDGFLVANVSAPNVTCSGIVVPWFVPNAGGGN
jgi:hypothetical protein